MGNQEFKIDPQILLRFKRLFFPRLDTYAIQRRDGTGFYTNIKKSVTGELIQGHFEDKVTLGSYCLSFYNQAHFTVLDVDEDGIWKRALPLITELEAVAYLEPSRRGGHVWFFHEQP